MTMALWPHQERAIAEAVQSIKDCPTDSICITSPTGGGKSIIMFELIRWATQRNWKTILYTNRKMLLDQLSKNMEDAGIAHGRRAASHAPELWQRVQISSLQTECSRVLKKKVWEHHPANLVLIDEAHVNASATALEMVRRHKEDGAAVIGFTATPLDLGHFYQRLIQAGTNSELRRCGALLPCHLFAPDEPASWGLKRMPTGEFKIDDVRKLILTPTIIGRVVDWYYKINERGLPAILFAPGVGESKWFARKLCDNGIPAAHIDGQSVWVDEEEFPSDRGKRAEVIERLRDGDLKVVCNRFVLREGIDLPFLGHAIFATIFGSIQSYIQSGGRLLRYYPGMEYVTVQDHGGNYWRYGSLNADRHWSLHQTAYVVSEFREQQMREGKEPEPIRCPKCSGVRARGPRCPFCGFQHDGTVRMVIQHDGSLVRREGAIFRPRKTKLKSNTSRIWETMFHRAKNAGMTFRQAEALFFHENRYWPPRDLNLMPKRDVDWFRKVRDVDLSSLRGYPGRTSEW